MKIEKAIEILNREVDGRLLNYPDQLKQAQKLGIEALEFKKAIRAHTVDDFDALLLGETED